VNEVLISVDDGLHVRAVELLAMERRQTVRDPPFPGIEHRRRLKAELPRNRKRQCLIRAGVVGDDCPGK
jgi:hypothetical protein